MGFGGPPEVVAGYLRATGKMTLGGEYGLAWSHVASRGGWIPGGEWPDREKEGASMGIWRRERSQDARVR